MVQPGDWDDEDEEWWNNMDLTTSGDLPGRNVTPQTPAPPKRTGSAVTIPSLSKKARAEIPDKATIVSRISPTKLGNDSNEYRVITLSNGLRAILIWKPYGYKADDILESISNAATTKQNVIEAKKAEFLLRNNFSEDFPIANLGMADRITELIGKEVDRESVNGKWSTSVCEVDTIGNKDCTFAVAVNVGFCDDPRNCNGLAHLTEHMVVQYGSEKYPGEENYPNFANNSCHEYNAHTHTNITTYHASLPIENVEKGVDMIASSLSKPTFDKVKTLREVNSIDSEFNLEKSDEKARRLLLLQYALGEHPLGKFGWGNEETLLECQNVYKLVRDFHAKYYVASAMTVGMECILPLDDQEELILQNFSSLPQGERKILGETLPTAREKQIGGKRFNMDYVMQGLSSFSNLWLLWPIPKDLVTNQASESISVLVKVLRDERDGSLAHYLKHNNYIYGLVVSDYLEGVSKYCSCIHIEFFLTPNGQDHVGQVMKATYAYLSFLQHLPDQRFQEVFSEMKWQRNREELMKAPRMKTGSDASAIKLAQDLQSVDPANILRHGNESWRWKDATYHPGEVGAILEHLHSKNMIAIQTLPKSVELKEYLNLRQSKVSVLPYCEAKFVAQGLQKRFGSLDEIVDVSQYNFRLMQTDANLRLLVVPPIQHGIILAQRLTLPNEPSAKVMPAVHYGNTRDNYRSIFMANYINAEALSTPKNYALALLWTTSIYLLIKEKYAWGESDRNFVLVPHSRGISVGVNGYSEKLCEEFEAVNRLFLSSNPISQEQVNAARESLLSLYEKACATDVLFITKALLRFVTPTSNRHSSGVLLDALACMQDCSVADVNNFSHAFKSKALVFLVTAGNVSIPMANGVVELINRQGQDYSHKFEISSKFFTQFCRKESTSVNQDISLWPGEKCVRLKYDHCVSYATSVTNFYYVGLYTELKHKGWKNCLSRFQERAFLELRMKQQLGYVIQVTLPVAEKDELMVISVRVIATAKKFPACHLDKCIDEFMVNYGKFLETVDQEVQAVGTGCAENSDSRTLYNQYFGETFASNDPLKYALIEMKKISVQILGSESKECGCPKCVEIEGWRKSVSWNHFQFAQGKGAQRDYFVDDPRKLGD